MKSPCTSILYQHAPLMSKVFGSSFCILSLPLSRLSLVLTLVLGSTSVKIKSTGHDKDRITAMLCVSAAGQWCQTLILNKLKTSLKKADQHGFRVRYQDSVCPATFFRGVLSLSELVCHWLFARHLWMRIAWLTGFAIVLLLLYHHSLLQTHAPRPGLSSSTHHCCLLSAFQWTQCWCCCYPWMFEFCHWFERFAMHTEFLFIMFFRSHFGLATSG